ncbi:MAG TPA: TIGR00266 family protein [Bryobacteraceae bacterium]|nr:TIGR00266 family protein [Bryobacteraceae bacterium]
MAFCTNCGTGLGDNARFCLNCGQPTDASAGLGNAAPPAFSEPLKYDIEGHNLQIARVHLQPGQEIYAEAGKMIYKSANVDWQTRMTGQSLGQKLWGAVKRKLMGESLFFTYFQANASAGEIGFAGNFPGKIQVFQLAPGQTIMVQRDGFLFAQASVTLDIAMVRRLGAGLLGGEGFILQKLTGPGAVFIHAGGDHVDFTLAPGEMLQVQTGHLVAFEPTVNYDVQLVGTIKTAVFGGEGLFLTTLTGPGRVILQSMTLERLRHELAPAGHSTSGDEKNPLGAVADGIGGLSSFFRSDD